MTTSTPRDWRFDALRVCMSYLVVLLHVAAYGCMTMTSHVPFVYDAVGRVAVPVFYMAAGAMALGRTEPLGKTWRRGLRRIVLPLAAASVAYALYRWASMGENPLGVMASVVTAPAYYHLPFMYTMVELYLILPLLMAAWPRLKLKEKLLLAMVVLCLDMPQVRQALGVRFLGSYVIGYAMLGGALRDAVQVFPPLKPAWWKACVLALGYLLASARTMQLVWGDSWELGYLDESAWVYQAPLVALAAVLIYLAVLLIPVQRLPKKAARVLACCNALTLGIYIVHPALIDTLVYGRLGFGATWNSRWPWVWIPVMSLGVWAVSAVMMLGLQQVIKRMKKTLHKA